MPWRLEDAVQRLAGRKGALVKIIFLPDLCNLLLKFYGDRFFKHKTDCGEAVRRFKRQLHVALVIIIHYRVALVMLFQKIQQCNGRIELAVLNEMFDKYG